MLDKYHVMMILYDISKCVIERLEVILYNYLKSIKNFFMVLYGFKKLNLTEKI